MKLARVLPVVRLVWLVVANRLRNVFSLEGLRYAALIVFTIVVGGGVIFVAVERGQDLSTWDGFYTLTSGARSQRLVWLLALWSRLAA